MNNHVQIWKCPCSYFQFLTFQNPEIYVLCFPIRNMIPSDFRFCNISRNPMCSNTNMSMFLFPIPDISEFGNLCPMFSNKEHAMFWFPIFDISLFETGNTMLGNTYGVLYCKIGNRNIGCSLFANPKLGNWKSEHMVFLIGNHRT